MLKQRLLMAASNGSPPPSTKNLWTWGYNGNGGTAQNTGAATYTQVPTAAVDSHSTWSQISAGADQGAGAPVVGLLSDGSLWSWGINSASSGGSTADGTIAQGSVNAAILVPTRIGALNTWAYVSQGSGGGMAVKTDGTLWSWGVDTYGQLGQGSGGTYYTPTQVGSGTTWAKCFCGYQISFMIKTDGTLWSLGRNSFYGTGLNTSSGNTTTPTQVGSSNLWVTVSTSGTYNAIGIRSDGTAWAWGSDQNGELGQGGTGSVLHVPTQIGSATDWANVSMSPSQGSLFTLLRKTGNTIWASGSNASYQTGRNTNSGNLTSPTQIGSASNWTQIAAVTSQGGSNGVGLALDSTGKIWSWGSNANYTTGQNTATGSTQVPTQIGSVSTWKYITGGGLVGIALK